jgi:hypothetical protein
MKKKGKEFAKQNEKKPHTYTHISQRQVNLQFGISLGNVFLWQNLNKWRLFFSNW